MPPVRHPSRKATFADLERLGEDAKVELIRGAIVDRAGPDRAGPRMEHGIAQASIVGQVGRRFHRKPGGRWPGGWWIAVEVDVEYGEHDVFCHDVVGWRRDRVPECPKGRPVRVRPDWVCEILSPSTEKRDLVDKMQTLRDAGVPHYWVVNPEEKVLIVHRLEPNGYLVALSVSSGDTVRAEPFHEVDLRVGVLFGDEDEDD